MTATAALSQDTGVSDVYDPDDVLRHDSPLLKAFAPNFELSPSPQDAELPPIVSHPLRSRRKSSNRRHKVPPSRGDAVLIHYLDGGAHPELADEAGRQPLTSYAGGEGDDEKAEEESPGGLSSSSEGEEEEEIEDDDDNSDDVPEGTGSPLAMPIDPLAAQAPGSIDLKFFAVAALSASQTQPCDGLQLKDEVRDGAESKENVASPSIPSQPPPQPPPSLQQQRQLSFGSQSSKPVLAAPIAVPISPYTPYGAPDLYSPRQPATGQVLRHPGDIQSPTGPTGLPTPSTSIHTPNHHGGLPPIQTASPTSDSNGNAPSLPSIRSHLGDQLEHPNFAEKEYMRNPHGGLPHSPPGAPRIPSLQGSQSSPPISPNNTFGNSFPSPAQSQHVLSPFGGYYSVPTIQPRAGAEYSGSSNADLSSNDPGSAPAASIADRMSIDNMTNPQPGSYACTFRGCNAPPFQTQYLLNSHANVHSSARPHYCSVKGCPRAEGGKGFKRKNEMIRHGLVHESPGYVCPFCADREHKYPRPDNLQR
jgi:hypothetical protein